MATIQHVTCESIDTKILPANRATISSGKHTAATATTTAAASHLLLFFVSVLVEKQLLSLEMLQKTLGSPFTTG